MRTPWATCRAVVVRNEPVDATMYRLTLDAPEIAATAGPGQFAMLRLPEQEPVLPRPFDLHDAAPAGGTIDIVYRVKGRGTRLLTQLPPHAHIEAQGPFGLRVDGLLEGASRIAVVGRGAGCSPLSFVAKRAHELGVEVDAYLSARNRRLLGPFTALRGFAHLTTQTDDDQPGSLVTDDLARDLDRYALDAAFVVGSRRLSLATLALAERHGFTAYGFAETYMPCGFGHCKACAIPTDHGYVLACMDGPVMNLGTVSDAYWKNAPS